MGVHGARVEQFPESLVFVVSCATIPQSILTRPLPIISKTAELSQSDHHTTDQDSGALHRVFLFFLVHPGSRSTQLSQSDHNATDRGSGALRQVFSSDSRFS